MASQRPYEVWARSSPGIALRLWVIATSCPIAWSRRDGATTPSASGSLQREAGNTIVIAADPDVVANAHCRAHALHGSRLIRTAESREGQRVRVEFDHGPARCGRDVGASGQKLAIRVQVDVVR